MHLIARRLLLVFALVIAANSWAQSPVEGRDFFRIAGHATADPNRIVVTEFFSYQCPHCFAFAEPLKQWTAKQAKDVLCTREAVSIGHAAWEPSARAFYALQSLQKLDAVDDAFFAAVHRDRVPLVTEKQIGDWLVTKGIPAKDFQSAYRAFSVDHNFKRGTQLAIAAKLPSVPTITIDGKYLVVIASNIDFAKQLALVDALIAKARAEKNR